MLGELKVIFPITARHFCIKKLHECFSVDFANWPLLLIFYHNFIDVYGLPRLEGEMVVLRVLFLYFLHQGAFVMMYCFLHFALHFVEVAHVAKCRAHAGPLIEIVALNSFWVVIKRLVYLAKMLADITLHFQRLHMRRWLLNDEVTQIIACLTITQLILNLG